MYLRWSLQGCFLLEKLQSQQVCSAKGTSVQLAGPSGNFLQNALLLQGKIPKLMVLLYSLVPYCPFPSHPHDTLLLDRILAVQHPALPLRPLSTYPAAAHQHSWPRRGCGTVSPTSSEENREDQQELILFTRSEQPNSVEFTSSWAR